MSETAGSETAGDNAAEAQTALIVGQGYVGLPLAMAAVRAGYDVIGLDTDANKVALLNSGQSQVEDIASQTVADARNAGTYRAVTNLDGIERFDIAVISVPTPLHEGAPDLRYIEIAATSLAPLTTPGSTVILESTTYPGTTEELVGPIIETATGLTAGTDFYLGYSPERIDPGNTVYTLETTHKVVSGVGAESLKRVQGFYDALIETTVAVSDPKVAELTKLLENTFRHVNIALVNELAMFARDLDIDVWEAIDAASTKPFGYMRFTPGPGVGGHCLPVDPSYLSWRVRQHLGQSFRFVELANDVNEHMPDYVIRRLTRAFNDQGLSVKGRSIVLLGMAYKANTGDARESPSEHIATGLLELGAKVSCVEPHVHRSQIPDGVSIVELTPEILNGADAVVLLVDHDDFDLDLVTQESSYIFDTKRALAGVDHRSATVETL